MYPAHSRDRRAGLPNHAPQLMVMDMLRNQTEPGVKAEDVPIEELSGIFEDRLSRISFLLKLVGIGYANEDFDPA